MNNCPAWIYWLAPAATLVAVLVALMKEEITSLWRKPKLVPKLEPVPPYCSLMPLKFQRTQQSQSQGVFITGNELDGEAYYVRLWVYNDSDYAARNVHVATTKLEKITVDDSWSPEPGFLPMNLKWSHSNPGKEVSVIIPQISPHTGRFCDVAEILNPNTRKEMGYTISGVEEGKVAVKLLQEVSPSNYGNFLKPVGKYRLEIQMAAENLTQPVSRTIEFNVTGDWFDEQKMFRDGVGVKMF